MKVLVTGTTSGLGKYLAELYKVDVFNRDDLIPNSEYDIILHCAYDRKNPIMNIRLTRDILSVPHKLFVYMSTVDIYGAKTEYSEIKQSCEELVKQQANEYLILRLGALVGKYMRPNNLTKMFNNEKMTLTKESEFAFIDYQTVSEEINKLIKKGQTGIFDIVGEVIALEQIAEDYGLSPWYGDFTYKTTIKSKYVN